MKVYELTLNSKLHYIFKDDFDKQMGYNILVKYVFNKPCSKEKADNARQKLYLFKKDLQKCEVTIDNEIVKLSVVLNSITEIITKLHKNPLNIELIGELYKYFNGEVNISKELGDQINKIMAEMQIK